MTASVQTDNLGPLVSLTTTEAAPSTVPHLYLDSNTSLGVDGSFNMGGTLTSTGLIDSNSTIDNAGGVFLSRATTASVTSATLADGEFAIDQVSATSAVLVFRSGGTTYEWIADTGAVK
jgi:hypothetical protein